VFPAGLRMAASATLGSSSPRFAVRRSSGDLSASGGGVASRFMPAGVSVASGGASVAFDVLGVGYGGTTAPASRSTAAPVAHQNRVVYSRSGVAEWYANGPAGLEQGFTLARRPAGAGGGRPLTVVEDVTGDLVARQAGQTILFSPRAGGPAVLRYGGLTALDAGGRKLPAHLELSGTRLLLSVDDRGARYPLTIDPYVQQGDKLVPTDTVTGEGELGWSVALSDNGDTAIVGAPAEGTSDGGAAWVFTRSGGVWSEQAELFPSNASGPNEFGLSVGLSSTGDTAIVGGPLDNDGKGAAWVFTRSGTTWSSGTELLPSDESGSANFGWAVALSDNGLGAVVGGPQDTDPVLGSGAGAAWAFVYSAANASWQQDGSKITPTTEASAGEFGYSVAMAGTGHGIKAVIGAPSNDSADSGGTAGSAYVFDNQDGWHQEGPDLNTMAAEHDNADFGWSVSISGDESTVLVGAPFDANNFGAAWTFVYSAASDTWPEKDQLVADDESANGAGFGFSVALSTNTSASTQTGVALVGGPFELGDGNTPDIGAGWVFDQNSDGWHQDGTKLRAADAAGVAFAGYSAAIDQKGLTVLLGGPFDANNGTEGAAFVFVPGAGVSDESANVLDDQTAEVFGTVDPNGTDTTYHVEYGTTTDYGSHTPDRQAPAADGLASVDETLVDLTPETTYHYRIVATNSAGTAYGPDQTFTTGQLVNATATDQFTAVVAQGVGCPTGEAQINWGDGSDNDFVEPNCHFVSDQQVFTVSGTHTYGSSPAYPVHYRIAVTVSFDSAPETLGAGALVYGPSQTLDVTTTDDNFDNGNCQPADCSLRQAINAANAGDGTFTIDVPAGTYQLSTQVNVLGAPPEFGALTITNGMTIVGDSARTTTVVGQATLDRSADGNRVFDIAQGAGPVTIQRFTIEHGTATPSNGFFGGNVRNQGTLTLAEDTITDGSAYSGGGVSNDGGTMTIDRSTITDNVAPYGGADSGGVQNTGGSGHDGHLTITTSTITGNSASNGGGVFSWGDTADTVDIVSSTITNNTSTAAFDGGGLRVTEGTMNVTGSIVSSNTEAASTTPVASNCSTGVASGGFNLEDGTDCGFTSDGDQQSKDPQLSALADNPGPADETDTMAIAATSPAVDAANDVCLDTDQRGLVRPQGAACDVGAYELVPSPPANDDFANATPISGTTGETTGTNVGATEQTGEPLNLFYADVTTGKTVWWTWTAPESGTYTFDALTGSSFLPVIGIFTGSSVDALTEVDSSNIGRVTFTATGGTTYGIQIGSANGDAVGSIDMVWNESPSNDNFANAATMSRDTGSIDGSNVGATREPGEPGEFTKTVWYAWTPLVDGTAVVSLDSSFAADMVVYTGDSFDTLVSAGSDSGTTPSVQLSVTAGTTYYVQIGLGSVDATAGPFTLSWTLGPTNDDFVNRIQLSGASGSTTGTNVGATTEPSEPLALTAATTGKTVWWEWTAPSTGTFEFDTVGTGFDTVLGIFRGSTEFDGMVEVASNDDISDGDMASRAGFQAVEGTTYYIQVGSFEGLASGPIDLNWNPGPANDFWANAQPLGSDSGELSGDATNASREPGEPDQTEGGLTGTVWYSYTPTTDGTATINTSADFDSALAVYTGDSFDSLTLVPGASNYDSFSPTVTFDVTGGQTYWVQVGAYDDTAGPFSIDWFLAPPNDNFANAVAISGATGATTGTNANATTEVGEPTRLIEAGVPTGATVWWAWTAPSTGNFAFATEGSTFDTTLGVFTGPDVADLTEVASNDDVGGGDTTSNVGFHAVAGTTYYIQVGSYGGEGSGTIDLAWSPGPANDDFAAAAALGADSGSLDATTLGATFETGEPDPFDTDVRFLQNTVWYSWTPSGGGPATVTASAAYFGALAVYTGGSLGSLKPVGQSNGTTSPSVAFTASPGTTYWIQVGSYDVDPGPFTLTWNLTSTAPVIAGSTAQSVGSTSATAVATINPNNSDTTVFVNYGTTTSYGQSTAPVDIGAGATGVPFSQALGGLAPNTTYHYQIVATSSAGGTTLGPDVVFTTTGPPPTPPPDVAGAAASNVQSTSASVAATVNPNGSPTTYHVDYGPTTGYGSQTPETAVGSGTSPVSVSQLLSPLASNTSYHFRFVATNSNGTTTGADATFTTLAAAPPPPPPGGGGTLPPPVQNQSVNVLPFIGPVLVNGVLLTAGMNIPIGSIVDARNGTVILQISVNGVIQTGQFSGGIFQITQLKDGTIVLVLKGGDFSVCKATKTTRLAENAHTIRRLWGNAKGNFQTKGRYAAATVRGTVWLVADRCDGTYVRVRSGLVSVQNFVTKKTTFVKAGQSYLAKPK
jgi:CSLREA domain-containing protein